MADEELTTKVSVEGFEDFEKAFEKMAADLDTAEGALKDLGGESKKTSSSMDQAGQSFDKNAAKSNQLKLATLQLADVQKQLTTETDALKRAQLEVRADSLRQQIENLSKAEDDSAQNTQKMRLSLTDLKSGIDMAIGAVKAFAAIAKGAFEFAQEGAAINATKESFDRLGISIEGLRAASNNTIPDMALMSSTLTLMAGSGGEVADAFSGAMPQLLAMAKAANKLNPTMGDTAFMLQSITTAAKRQSMQIADNLGIIVKQGDAYKKYADSIGVSVTALTNEQKQVAFLNGLLEAGNVLIEQAGGATESAADGYAQMTTQVKNATDSMKALAAEAVGPTISKFAQMLVSTNEVRGEYGYLLGTMAGFGEMLGADNTLIDKHNEELAELAIKAELAAKAQAMLSDSAHDVGVHMVEVSKQTFVVSDAMRDAEGNIINSADAWDQYAKATADAALPLAAVAESMERVGRLKGVMGASIGEGLETAQQKLGDLRGEATKLEGKITDLEGKSYLTGAQQEELGNLRGKLGDVRGEIGGVIEDAKKMAGAFVLSALEAQISSDGMWTQAEADMFAHTGRQLGMFDEVAAGMISMTATAVENINSGAMDATEATNLIISGTEAAVEKFTVLETTGGGAMEEIASKSGGTIAQLIDVGDQAVIAQGKIDAMKGKDIDINVKFNVPSMPQFDFAGKGGTTREQAWQHGGTTPGGAFIAGDQGAELITGVRGGARVMSAPTTARMMAQNSVTNNFNLTTNSLTRPGGLALEFATMGMGSR